MQHAGFDDVKHSLSAEIDSEAASVEIQQQNVFLIKKTNISPGGI